MFKDKLALVPNLPGSYQMLDENNNIIYVGKAKNLHKRLASYFNKEQSGKTKKLVEDIKDFKYIVATSELEAFLIEINLIKKYNPKYNILLKDDKSYPYIEYIKKPYPQLKISRYLNIKKKDNKILFGPYPNASAARKIVDLINRLYPLKKCIGKKKEVCLYYHIGECLGYCSKKLDNNKVDKMEQEILSFLRGNDKIIKDRILEKINNYSENLNYEMALSLKNDLKYIDIIMEKQKVELHDLINRDIIGYFYKNGYLSINIFFLRNGKLVGNKNSIFPCLNDDLSEIDEIEYYIANFYSKHEIPKEIFISNKLNKDILKQVIDTKFITPLKGIKKELLNMAEMNAKINYDNKFKLIIKEEEKTTKANDELKNILGLKELRRIDVFDNSNLFGDFSVSGMVVFEDGKPNKNEYRKFKISFDKNDDYHMMQEVIFRRYERAIIEKNKLPDLIIVDGGELQIKAAKEILNDLNLDIKVVGLKKDDKHKTSILVNSDLSLINLDITSNVFLYLTRMQDEVHRFAINYHRQIRSKGSISSILDNIKGLGTIRKKELIKKYGSIKKMSNASIDELNDILPLNVATTLYNYLKEYKKEGDNNENN